MDTGLANRRSPPKQAIHLYRQVGNEIEVAKTPSASNFDHAPALMPADVAKAMVVPAASQKLSTVRYLSVTSV